MPHEIDRCSHCYEQIEFDRYHAGFGNQGYMYCDRDSTVLTWDSYDPVYTSIVGPEHPWMLDRAAKLRVESAALACPCGGSFAFENSPRCPHCRETLPALARDPSYFVILAGRVDGNSSTIWKTPE